MSECCYTAVLTARGPILTASSVTQAMGVDVPAARRQTDGKLYLPGSLIRGKVREQADFLGLSQLAGLFGQESGNRKNGLQPVDPRRSEIFFTDFVDQLSRSSARRTRIGVDEIRGAANDQMLAILESPYAPGEEVDFSGQIRFFAAPDHHSELERQLTAALRAVSSVGSQRTAGFGRVVRIQITPTQAGAPARQPVTGRTVGLVLSTADLICVAKAQPAENLFETSQVLPGNVIKGAIATTWCLSLGQVPAAISGHTDSRRQALGEIFDQIRFRHARPVHAGGRHRPLETPLSMIWYGGGWKDTALIEKDPAEWAFAPSFEPDWKGKSPGDLFGQVKVPLELRVRTAIDRNQRRAEDEKLFAYEMLSPGASYEWVTYVDFPEVAPAEAVAQLQDLLASGIDAFGKTKAKLRCEFFTTSGSGQERGDPAPRDGLYVVVLQTPALLNNPLQYNHDLRADYARAWSDLSAQTLELSHFRARQELAGGFYQQRRFGAGQQYRPWLLTCSGSVFVLKPVSGKETDAARIVGQWLRYGLRVPAEAAEFYKVGNSAADWARCPYICQNGFGEISINADIHWTHRVS